MTKLPFLEKSEAIIMRMSSSILFGIYAFLLAITSSFGLSCPRPDIPEKGDYLPKLKKFLPGDTITYHCSEGHALVGKETSKCRINGGWSHPTPFCDGKALVRSPSIQRIDGSRQLSAELADGDCNTCDTFRTTEKIEVHLRRPKVVLFVRLFMHLGPISIAIYTGRVRCGEYHGRHLSASEWVAINCENSSEPTNIVGIFNQLDPVSVSSVCEIEVYVKEEDECDKPPDKKVANGFLEVSRSKAKLICEEGYDSGDINRLVCVENDWSYHTLHCNEILCNPVPNIAPSPGGEWMFLEPVLKISVGTRRQLKCGAGYRKTGGSDVIFCQMDGTWTQENAICVEEEKSAMNAQIITYASVGTVVALIVIVSLGATIYFVRRERLKQVKASYTPPPKDSVISEDDISAYYEIMDGSANAPALPPKTSQLVSKKFSDGPIYP